MSLPIPTPRFEAPSYQTSQTQSRRKRVARAIFAVDLVILLAPPVHWLFAKGGNTSSLWYFLAANALVTLSLFALWLTARTDGDEKE